MHTLSRALSLLYDVNSHVFYERFGYGDRSVGVLVILKYGGRRSADGKSAAVECVDQAGLAACVAELDVGAAGLEIHELLHEEISTNLLYEGIHTSMS
jgi:hypothetical protein